MSTADQEQPKVVEATPEDGTASSQNSTINAENENTKQNQSMEPQETSEDASNDTKDPDNGEKNEEAAIDENSNVEAAERKRKHISTDFSDDDLEKEEHNDQSLQPTVENRASKDRDSSATPSSRQELEEKLDRILKKPKVRRTRRDEDDLEQYLDEKILRLKDEMNIAAQLDIDTLNKRIETGDTSLIAMQKVKLLPKVVSVLSKANLADTILDNNLLQSVRIWLEPLPDGSLPSFEIQKSLFAALNDLPVKTEHLKESGLGRVVIFYTKSKRVEAQLARLAEKLIAEWTRPIIGASDNYRDKRIMQLEFDSEKLRKKSVMDSAKNRKKKSKSGEDPTSRGSSVQTLYEQAAARRNRAAAPAQTTTDYKYAPVSNLSAVPTNARAVGVGSTLNNSEMYKRLTSRLNKKHK
ncbi:CNT_collapsed_G0059080.mRNA.1.CDS.1 [Saccharomyces cerevisiae]|nr:CNT_collapsed_G0059080.mRNA.1.CDS.1 [Saccharomyces cerevisiae]